MIDSERGYIPKFTGENGGNVCNHISNMLKYETHTLRGYPVFVNLANAILTALEFLVCLGDPTEAWTTIKDSLRNYGTFKSSQTKMFEERVEALPPQNALLAARDARDAISAVNP
jgi:hypothetical protein